MLGDILFAFLKGHHCPAADCSMEGVSFKAVLRAEGEQREQCVIPQHNAENNTPETYNTDVIINKLKTSRLISRYTK